MVKENKDLEGLYRKYWNTDKEEIIRVHECGSKDLEECIRTTMEPLGRFPVFEFEDDMGFFGFESPQYLSTFFVHPKNRNSADMRRICEVISAHLEDPFYIALFDKNDKAQKFIIKNGGYVVGRSNHLNEDLTLFKIDGGLKCQYQ